MGFKKLIHKGTCRDCGVKLPIPTWSICDNCNPHSFRNRELRKKLKIAEASLRSIQNEKESLNNPTLYKYKNYNQVPNEIIIKASILIYDDITGKIIGYKI